MKIIKITHANTTNDIEPERESLVIQSYNIEDFLLRNKAEIIEQAQKQFKEEWEAQSKFTHFKFASIITPNFWMDAGVRLVKNLFIEGDNQELEAYAKHVVEIFDTLVIRNTITDLLQDIINRLERVEIISLEAARDKYPRTRNLSIGTYTLHPRDSLRLTRIEHYHKNLALEKDDELIVLLGRMGARLLTIKEVDTEQHSGSISMEFDEVSVDVKGDINLSRKSEENKGLRVRFEGNLVDIESSLLENSLWFSDDSRLLAIFESRRFNPNKIEEYTLRTTYTETFDFDFKLAAGYLVVQADLEAEYQAISKKERSFHIEFGKSK